MPIYDFHASIQNEIDGGGGGVRQDLILAYNDSSQWDTPKVDQGSANLKIPRGGHVAVAFQIPFFGEEKRGEKSRHCAGN